ncbi:MAG: MGMT family protein, partial [Actinomycetota bacterium]
MPDLNERFMGVAAHIQPGEWTTYGDISAAVRGDKRAARAVGRAAATEEEFPNPHRVLRSPGRISP